MKTELTIGLLCIAGLACFLVRERPETRLMRVTAYCICEKCCYPYSDGITASGTKADHKLIAADRSIPFGTKISVPGYGTAVVEDRGGAITGERLDLLFPSHQEALNWGVKHLEVKIWN